VLLFSLMGQRDKEKAKIQAERGQALTEVLIALGISTIIIASVAVGVILTVRSNSQGVMVRQAVSLAEELADKLRSIAEGQWQTLYNLSAKGTATDYYVVQSSTSTWAIVQGAEGVLENEIRAGLVGHWGFDEATTTTAYDSSGNANNGTLTNGPTRTASSGCKISWCLSFDGVDDYVWLGSPATLNVSNFTIAAWFKTVASPSYQLIYRWRSYGIMLGVPVYTGTTGKCGVAFYDSASTLYKVESPQNCNDGNWHFAVGTYDGQNLKLYVDGILVATTSTTASVYYGSGGVAIGRDGSNNAGYFNGIIDDVRIYNRALSADEVRQIYKARVFTRSFVVENVNRDANQNIVTAGGTEDPSTQKITIKVNWSLAAGSSQLNLVEYLTRFRNEVTRFTDWSGQEGVAGPITTPDSNFFSQSGISTSTAGEIKLAN
jgi:hypothetical protein